jgi:hypothetical protein
MVLGDQYRMYPLQALATAEFEVRAASPPPYRRDGVAPGRIRSWVIT